MDVTNTHQVVLVSISAKSSEPSDSNPEWLTNALLVLPICVAALSLLSLLIHGLYAKFLPSKAATAPREQTQTTSRLSTHVADLGGSTIFTFKTIRFAACLALLGLAISSTTLVQGGPRRDSANWIMRDGVAVVFLYAAVLGLVSVAGGVKSSKLCSTHLVCVLLASWILYFYRDVWPLCTFTLSPVDADEGWLIWTKVAVLSVAAVIVPLFMPRQHTPIDPADIPKEFPLTDTTSVFSMAVHSYCDPVVYMANKVRHLKLEELPVLSDKNYTKNLVNRSYPYIDPLLNKRRRHIGLSLIFDVFLMEHLELALMLILRIFTSFLPPLGINRLLNFIETGGEGAIVKPWVWVVWLLLGPMLGSLVWDWYHYRVTNVMTQCQAMITQLFFDHALRMRVISDVAKTASIPETESPVPSTPDRGSVAESTTIPKAGHNPESVSIATSSTKVQSIKKSTARVSGTKTATPADKAKKGTSGNLVGKLTNLVTTDLATLQGGQAFLQLLVYIPAQLVMSMLLLHSLLGWSIYPGLAVMAVMMPIPGYVAKLLRGAQVEKMKTSDSRVQSVTETMNVIRMVKLFGWEPKTSEQLNEKRQLEMSFVRKLKLLKVFNSLATKLIPLATIVVTYGTYVRLHPLYIVTTVLLATTNKTVIMKETLTASKVFASMAIFELIQAHFAGVFSILPNVIAAKVSLDRMNEFLNETELLDEYTQDNSLSIIESEIEEDAIGIRAAAFTWTVESDGTATPGSNQRNFTLKIEDEVFFKRNCINLVIGQTGCGKTSLLMALLGEMHYTSLTPDSIVSLPRGGGVAYHAQESWILNETIRNNIIFGSPYDEDRYNAVVEQCGLNPDLALFNAGDQTEVGEKGLTLSGGQKARVTLARAVYSSAKILLLDDVLAALDVHTAKGIVEKCFRGELLRDRTVILVTHNVALTAPVADFVVALGPDGRILSQGSLSSALAKDKKLESDVTKERQAIELEEKNLDETSVGQAPATKPKGQLIVEEEIALGHLGWSALKLYLGNMQGAMGSIPFWTAFVCFAFLAKVFAMLNIWVLGVWTREYEGRDPLAVPVVYYIILYTSITLISFVIYALAYATWVLGSVRASRRIHHLLIDSVFGATMRWLDKTPISRVITRCTQDIASIDGNFALSLYNLVDTVLLVSLKLGAVIVVSPIFSIPGLIVIVIGGTFGHLYMRAQLPVKRESSNAKAPVLGHFNSAVTGLVSIRAYGAQAAFRKESYIRIDKFTRAQITYWNLNRWIGVRSSILAGMFSSALGAYLVYGPVQVDAATIGFSLTMAAGFSNMILWVVRLFNRAEVEGNSMERVQQYLNIEKEPKATKAGEPPAYWPASGDLRVEGLSARYSVDGPTVLHDLSFHVKSGERVGIVGRTGSGKSSLTLSLLRCIVTEGNVFYDGISTNSVNLDALRSHITIIPQVPELLRGTLRQNLDPFSQHDDVELNDALRSAGLFSLQNDDDEDRITLDTAISGGGSNVSVGQRQILALARAIIRRSKLLILDEATSAIDFETDNIIQTSLRSKLDKDVTLLTVAHRLQTIMDSDRIMVLDAGRIAEFDKPSELLKNERGLLRLLVDESGDKEKLYAMANGTG
ncbi:hypothetical protein EUX98_g3808 [Antrodiella citrinella]|uniref:P-loop containing nucleoside triphosphate hydrolase protein n=1 Tax=Antrodiella citrinella TaxID=2447956 RepID=A0A4S4N3S8_9APHY|nr:hypothetical protein EUX98_g3808 [Antrodiella citrinella]